MPDQLYEAIKRAINEEVDGDEFERCVVDLLRDYYPSLRPLSGGNDAGQDGMFELPDGRRGFIVSTTERDYAGNLRGSVKSHLKAGGDRRVVVLATTRRVTGQMREKLKQELEREFEFALHDVHDRGDFIPLLYRNSQWRKDLLGVPGVAGALTRIPLIAPPIPPMPLIGREEELEQLRSAQGDLIVVGKPGIGKTFLFQQLMEEDWGLFDALRDIPELEDAIRDFQPQRVIIDDAHLAPNDRVRQVLRLRREMEADFAIVVVTWPGYFNDVNQQLPEAEIVTVEELDRGEIIEVVNAAGLSGPDRLLMEINDQVRGRAGLAVMLARACLFEDAFDVATGRRLLAGLTYWYTGALPDLRVNCAEIFGVLALAGDSGVSTAEVAAALGDSEPSVREAIRSLATGGTIDEIDPWRDPGVRRLLLQPKNLRAAAVEQAFFTGPGSVEIEVAAGQLRQASGVGLVLTEAALRGAPISRDMIRRFLHWSDRQSVVAFGCLGEPELREAVQRAPQHSVAIATEAYRARVGSAFAIRVLLDHALGQHGPLDMHSWDPLQVIARHLHGTRCTVKDRRLVIQVTDHWLSEGGDPEVGARALKHALYPGIDDTSLDPGLGDTLHIVQGVESAIVVAQISELWDEALDAVSRHPGVSLDPLIDALRDWFFPDMLLPDDTAEISRELQNAMRDTGDHAIRRIALIFKDRPVALRALEEFSRHPRVGVEIEFDIPPHIDVLVPLSDFLREEGTDWRAWEDATSAKVRELADEALTLSPGSLAQFIVETCELLLRDRPEREVTSEFRQLTSEIAQVNDDCPGLLAELERLGAAWVCRAPFLERIVNEQLGDWDDLLASYINREDSWPSVLLALRYPVSETTKTLAAQRIDGRHAFAIRTMVSHNEIDEPTLALLLGSSDTSLAAHVALNLASPFGERSRESLSKPLNQRCRELVTWFCVRVSGPRPDDRRLSGIFERDQTLLVLVIERWFEVLAEFPHALLPFGIEESVADLPLETRLMLISKIPEGAADYGLSAIVEALVSQSVDAARGLFDRSELRELHHRGLVGEPTASWMARALAALDHGMSAADIVSCSLPSKGFWMGDLSARWQERIDMFENLREDLDAEADPRVIEIIDAGIEHFTELRDSALADERRRRVFGHAGC